MQINIKTSGENQAIVTQLTKKLTGGTKENVIARIALGYSLSTGKRFTQQEFSAYDSQGKEYKDHILFDGQYRDFYIALICQAYGITKNDELIPKYIKLHIDHGLKKINYLFENNTKAINKFLGLSEKDGSRTMRNLEKLDNGQCVSNIKELQKGDLFEVVQYWKEK